MAHQLPQLAHEDPGVLAVEEPGQVDLHLPRVRVLNRGETRVTRGAPRLTLAII